MATKRTTIDPGSRKPRSKFEENARKQFSIHLFSNIKLIESWGCWLKDKCLKKGKGSISIKLRLFAVEEEALEFQEKYGEFSPPSFEFHKLWGFLIDIDPNGVFKDDNLTMDISCSEANTEEKAFQQVSMLLSVLGGELRSNFLMNAERKRY